MGGYRLNITDRRQWCMLSCIYWDKEFIAFLHRLMNYQHLAPYIFFKYVKIKMLFEMIMCAIKQCTKRQVLPFCSSFIPLLLIFQNLLTYTLFIFCQPPLLWSRAVSYTHLDVYKRQIVPLSPKVCKLTFTCDRCLT